MIQPTVDKINSYIRDRRSIYPNMYEKGNVPQEIIEQILENANWAPTHKLTEPWRFIVFAGDGLKELANFQANQYKKHSEIEDSFDPVKYEKLKNKPLKASHIIAMVMKRDQKERVPEVEELIATACAMQNIYLTTSAYGLGAYFSTGGVTYDQEAKTFLKLSEKDRLLGFFYIGLFDGKWPKGKRTPIQDKVEWRT